MISQKALLEGIRKRYREGEPLNITATKREAPQLIKKAFDPNNREFLGWRGALEKAGVDYSKIKIHLAAEIECPICSNTYSSLMSHLSRVHQATGAEFRKEDPHFELLSEEILAERAGLLPEFTPSGRKPAVTEVPHWEPLWTMEYALDRIRYLYDEGYKIHNRALHELDQPMKFFVFYRFPSYDDFLQLAGLDPNEIRKLRHRFEYTPEFIIEILQKHHKAGDSMALTAFNKRYPGYSWAVKKIYGSHKEALAVAELDPEVCGVIIQGEKTKKQFREEARQLLRDHPDEIPEDELEAFRKRWTYMANSEYGGWAAFAKSMRVRKATFFRRTKVYSREELLRAVGGIKRRKNWGAEDIAAFREKWGVTMSRNFSSWESLAEFANISPELFGLETESYRTRRQVLAGIRRHEREGFPMFIGHLKKHDPALARAVRKFYDDDWYEAFADAEVQPGRRKRCELSKQQVLELMQERYEAGLGVLNKQLTKTSHEGGDQRLHLAILRYFGSIDAALAAAGLPSAEEQLADDQGPSMELSQD